MFAVLGLSEEREPVAVLKSASKRAQRRAQRAEARCGRAAKPFPTSAIAAALQCDSECCCRQQENVVDKGPKSALDWQNEVALQVRKLHVVSDCGPLR